MSSNSFFNLKLQHRLHSIGFKVEFVDKLYVCSAVTLYFVTQISCLPAHDSVLAGKVYRRPDSQLRAVRR